LRSRNGGARSGEKRDDYGGGAVSRAAEKLAITSRRCRPGLSSTATQSGNGGRGGGGGERSETLRKPLTGHCDVDIAVAAPFFD